MTYSEVAQRALGKGVLALLVACVMTAVATRELHATTQSVAAATPVGGANAPEALFSRPVTIDIEHVSLKAALKAIATTTGAQVQYAVDFIEAYKTPVTLHVKQAPFGA